MSASQVSDSSPAGYMKIQCKIAFKIAISPSTTQKLAFLEFDGITQHFPFVISTSDLSDYLVSNAESIFEFRHRLHTMTCHEWIWQLFE
jgi:hypothetical protein